MMPRVVNKMARKKMAGCLAVLVLAILCLGAREARADVITFDDVTLPPGGSQQISPEHYLSLGVRIHSARSSSSNPVILSTADADTPPNIIWGGPTDPSQGDSNGLYVHFTFPGTMIPSATNFISFHVIDNGDQQREWTYQIIVQTSGEPQNFYLKGSDLFSFSSPLNDIWSFSIFFLDRNAISGIDSLTFNAPTNPVPEPATMLLLGSGLAGLAAKVRSRRKAGGNE